jgi:hypothetical protein
MKVLARLRRNQRWISRARMQSGKKALGICCCVMLNEVKHLLCAFPNFLDQETKGKSRFFVATLLRMTFC